MSRSCTVCTDCACLNMHLSICTVEIYIKMHLFVETKLMPCVLQGIKNNASCMYKPCMKGE